MTTQLNQITVDSSALITLLGNSFYTGNPVVITTRELLQNAWDTCQRKGVNPKITITIDVDPDKCTTTVVCDDNGEGMDISTIVDKYLCLGRSGKASGVGGFGIAAFCVLTARDWQIHTLDNYLDKASTGQPIARVKPRVGTSVKVTLDWVTDEDIIRAAAVVYLSDVKVHLILKRSGVIWHDDPRAGLKSLYRGTGKTLSDKSLFKIHKYSVRLFSQVDKGAINFAGLDVYRLGGLVQFINNVGQRTTNLIVDVSTDKRPGESGYPFSASREDVAYTIKCDVSTLSIQNCIDKRSSENQASKAAAGHREKIKQISGVEINRSRDFPDDSIITITVDYKSDRRADDRRLLKLWARILHLVTDAGDYYGVGLTSDSSMNACRRSHGAFEFYVLNPGCVGSLSDDKDAIIYRLWHLATHEAAHYKHRYHDEDFSSYMGYLAGESAPRLAAALVDLKKILRRYGQDNE